MTGGHASAPASSGNLGPGFDVLALALDLRCRVDASPAPEWRIVEGGSSYEPSADDFVRTAVAAMAPGSAFRLAIDNAIPSGRGLGSSAAVATAAGAAAVRSLGEEPSSSFLFGHVAALEGHPDNAGAAVYGGLVAAGGGIVRRLEMHPGLRVVVGIPHTPLSTSAARAVLPSSVERPAVMRSLARVVFLVDGLRSGDRRLLAAAGGDELHEAPRRSLSPVTATLMQAARGAGALHAAWSGAGPTAIAFTGEEERAAVQAAMAEALGEDGTAVALDVSDEGWR